MSNRKNSGRALAVLLSVGALLVGGAAGAFASVAPAILSPVGLSAGTGIETAPMPAPDYPINENGLTYGSVLDAVSPETEPDLISVVATNGKEGYVLKTTLAEADGSNMPTKEAALEWMANGAKLDHVIPVYEVDGKTAIGEFIIYGTNSLGAPPKP